jgi:serine protease
MDHHTPTRRRQRTRLLGALTALVALATLMACTDPGPPTSSLMVSTFGDGGGSVTSDPPGIDCGLDCEATFADGTQVTLTAWPDPGSSFGGWSGCDSVTGHRCRVTLAGGRGVAAGFVRDTPGTGAISGTLVFPGEVPRPLPEGRPSGTPADGPGAGTDVAVVPGEVVVRFAADTVRPLATLQVAGIRLAHVRSLAASTLDLYRAEGLTRAETLALAAAFRTRPDVEDAFPNWLLHPLRAPDDEFYPLQWHYPAINLPTAWAIEDGTGAPVTVAVVDTGVVAHPDLTPNLRPGYDFVDRDDDPTDEGGATDYHGTHVAGTVAAATNNRLGVAGVSWGAQVVPVRVIGSAGSGTSVDILDGIIWAAGNPEAEPGLPPNPNPARVVNLSVGGNIGQACPASLEFVFARLVSHGTILVAAAGNDGIDAEHTFPAHCPSVIAVGATGPTNERAPYSNYGSEIDLMAPGGDISKTLELGGETIVAGVLSTIMDDEGEFEYGFYQGTSMAAPHVAGVVALLLARDPALTPAAVKARLEGSARPLDAAACRRPTGAACGAGLIDAAAALTTDVTAPPPPPPPPPPPVFEVPTFVVAFHCIAAGDNPCADFDFDQTGELIVPTDGNRVPYRVPGLAPGTYLVAAWQDLDENVEPDEGEPVGIHQELITLAAGEERTGVTIHLEPLAYRAARHDAVLEALSRRLQAASER